MGLDARVMPAAPSGRLRLAPEEHRRLSRNRRLRREVLGWAFLAPMFLCFVIFLVLPVLGTVWWSLRSGGLGGDTKFVGLKNFIDLPDIVGASAAVTNTLVFA